MNKLEYINYLKTIYDRVGEPEIAKNDPVDIERRAAMGQKWYQVPVAQITTDTEGRDVSKVSPVQFYVYDEGEPGERAVSVEKAPSELINPPEVPNTFQQDAIEWFKVNKDPSIRKFGINEIIAEIEIVRFRVMALDENGDMNEWLQVVWKEGSEWYQAKYNGTYNI